MLRLAGKASSRRRPVTSTLGSTWGQAGFRAPLAARHEVTLANRVALGQAGSTLLPRVSPTRPAFRLRRAAIRPPTPAARRAHSLPPPTRLANAVGRCLTCRSTGRATARHPGREPLAVYPAPRGQGASPPRAGYLYVRPHVRARTRVSSLEALARQLQFLAHFGHAEPSLGPSYLHSPGLSRSAHPKASAAGATRRHTCAATRAIAGSVVVGASRQRAAPRSLFVSAPPAMLLVCLAHAVQAAL
jgi:hypothetical protein